MLTYKDIKIIFDDIKKLTGIENVSLHKHKGKNCPYVAYVLRSPNRIYVAPRLFTEHLGIIYFHLFHEFGHIYYDKHKLVEKAEYLAEKFALKYMKKYFKMYYFTIICYRKQFLNFRKNRKIYPNHYSAYSRIKEYK